MKIYLTEKSYFTFRGVESHRLDILGSCAYELMKENLGASEGEGEGERVVLEPVYPFLTKETLFAFLEEREGSFRFPGGYVVREGTFLSETITRKAASLGQGLFSLSDYAQVLSEAERESAKRHIAAGALVEEGAQVSFSAKLGEGVIVRKGAKISGHSTIGKNTVIGAGSEITESEIGEECIVTGSTLLRARVGRRCTVGPNAYLRPGAEVGDGCRIGDFVEIKNAKIGAETKIAHLAYVGDAEVGSKVNIGCGVVFVNYDGRIKHKTVVGDRCFIGSNCNLIAPVTLGDGCFLAAGTTLTKDLKEDDFCVGRSREFIKPSGAKKYR